jgi:hypothetical protein
MNIGARGWILWVALAILTVDSLISLLPVVGELFAQISHVVYKTSDSQHSFGRGTTSDEVEPPSRLVPGQWIISGLLFSVISGTVIVWSLFGSEGIKPWATLLGFVLGGGMSLLG